MHDRAGGKVNKCAVEEEGGHPVSATQARPAGRGCLWDRAKGGVRHAIWSKYQHTMEVS